MKYSSATKYSVKNEGNKVVWKTKGTCKHVLLVLIYVHFVFIKYYLLLEPHTQHIQKCIITIVKQIVVENGRYFASFYYVKQILTREGKKCITKDV